MAVKLSWLQVLFTSEIRENMLSSVGYFIKSYK